MREISHDVTQAAHPAWSVLEAGLAAGLSVVSVFVIARLIGPAELGVGAAAVAVHVLLWVVVNALFADPLTSSASTDPREISAVFWASTGVGVLAALVQIGCGPVLALVLDDARLVPMCWALAAPLPLVGAAGAVQGLLTRARRYDRLAARAAIGQGVGVVLGITLALRGAGGWALVAQQVTTASLGAAVLLLRAGWQPIWAWRGAVVLAMLRQGLPLVAGTLVQLARYRLFLLLVGGMLGPAALGQLHVAFRLVDTVRELLATALWRVLLPSLSEQRDDLRGLAMAMDRMLGLYAVALLPVCGLLAISLEPVTMLVLGPDWAMSAEAALPLVGLLAWAILAFAANVGAIVRGAARMILCAHLAALGLTLTGAVLLQPETSVQAVWVWVGAQILVLPWILWRLTLVLERSALALLQAGLPALAGMCVAALAALWVPSVWGETGMSWTLLVERHVVFALIYVPVAFALLRGVGWGGLRPVEVADAAR